jgi:hypothetical protein
MNLSVPQDLVERVQKALENMKAEGIQLWSPSVSDELEEIFEVVIAKESVGCTSDTCNHVSHDPASPYIKLIPKQGRLVRLGEADYGEVKHIFYVLIMATTTKYFRVIQTQRYYDEISVIDAGAVPDYLLARLC